jgi:pantothenate kinase
VTLSKTPVTTGTEAEVVTQVPSFNHAKKDPEADDIQITSKSRVVIVEGNYTLLNKAPWDAISRMVEDT